MNQGFDLTLSQTQKLVMTPELVQSIRLLQFSTMELCDYIEEELLVNPVLEEEYAHREALDEYLREYYFQRRSDAGEGGTFDRAENKDADWIYERYEQQVTTLAEHLSFQLGMMRVEERQRALCQHLIDSLDDSGYLLLDLTELVETYEGDCSEEDVEDAIALLQTMDPPGVCARSLAECLGIQLKSLGVCDALYTTILTEHLEDLSRHRLKEIAQKTGNSVQEVQRRTDLIRHLEPRPGSVFSAHEETAYLIPDVLMERDGDDYRVEINERVVPHLKISAYYEDILSGREGDEQTRVYLQKKLDGAAWLLRSIEQRKKTICRVAASIVEHQKEFFEKGDRYLKPLTMGRIAEELGIHESTVSRAVKDKYIDSPQGLYELRYFFATGVGEADSMAVSATSAKALLKEILAEENKAKPYSDQTIAKRMAERGIGLSRRTVAKYREEMGIPGSSKRRRY